MARSLCLAALWLIMAGQGDAGETLRHFFKTSDGITLSYLEAGPETDSEKKFSIALIPGWAMPATIWQKQLEVLGRRYNTLALDPRGQGRSEIAATGYTAERRASDIHEFLQRRPKTLLVGWSLGALEALQAVHMFGTASLAGLVLVDSSVGEKPAPRSNGHFQQRLREDRAKTVSEFVRAIFATERTEPELHALSRDAMRMKLEDSLAILDYPFERGHWKRIVLSFDKPLLYAVTRQFEQQAANLKKHRPSTQVEVFKKAGHALFVDQAERFNALLEKFAARISR